MNPLPIEAKEYLKSQQICVFAIEMPDGSPHAATVHFSHLEEPFVFLFETNKTYRKSEALFGRKESRATVVVGFGNENKTFQLDGIAELLTKEEQPLVEKYLEKFPSKRKKLDNPDTVFFKFTPTWWRFTDFEGGRKVWLSK